MHNKPRSIASALVVSSVLIGAGTEPAAASVPDHQLLDLSIEQLLDMEVTSASRKKQSLSETAAAVFVITQDDIRRSGARNIPEALRLAPGLTVAQIDANKWAISARGFAGKFANKLLVLMDGRTLYTPAYSGVFWDAQDTLIDNIERIEVIRGPGGTLWGSNAVNGIINIITRDARAASGGLASASHDDRDSFGGSLRIGGGDSDLGYTAFVKYDEMADNREVSGAATADGWHQARVGARLDWARGDGETITLTGEAYRGHSGDSLLLGSLAAPFLQRVDGDERLSGGFLLGRWTREWEPGRDSSVQIALDTTSRDSLLLGEQRDSVEVEAQHHFPLGRRNDVVIGANFHFNRFAFDAATPISIRPLSPTDVRVGAFIQDEVSLADGRLLLTLGSKFEHNDLSDKGVEVLPNVRASWKLAEGHNIWGAVTRSVRTPSYADLGATVTRVGHIQVVPPFTAANPLPLPLQAQVAGSPDFVSEKLTAFELGYRGQLNSDVALDVAAFLNHYDDLRSVVPGGLYCDSTGEPVEPPAPPACLFTSTSLLARLQIGNEMKLDTYGAEAALDWRVTSRLRVSTAYTYLHVKRESALSALDEDVAGLSPRHRLSVRGDLAIRDDLDVGLWLRYSDKLTATDIPSHWNADLRLAWRVGPRVEVDVVGRNLLHRARLEFITEMHEVVPTEIERSVTGAVRWRF